MKKIFVFFVFLGVLSFVQVIHAQSISTALSTTTTDIRETILWSHADLTLSLGDSCSLLDKEVQKGQGLYSALGYDDGLALKALGPEEYLKHFGKRSIILCGSSFEDTNWKKNQPQTRLFYFLSYSLYGLEISQAKEDWILNPKKFVTAMKKNY